MVSAMVALTMSASAHTGCRRREVAAPASGPAVPLAFDRDVLVLTLAHGTDASARVPISGTERAKARLSLRPGDHPAVRAHLESDALVVNASAVAEPGGSRAGLAVGTHVGNVVVETGLAEPATLTLPYSIRVTGTLVVSPTNPYFNLRDPEGLVRTVVVRSTAADAASFQVRAAEVMAGPFEAELEKAGPGTFHVQVRVREADLPDDARGVLGRLLIRSSDATEPVKELPLFAFGSTTRRGAPTRSDARVQ